MGYVTWVTSERSLRKDDLMRKKLIGVVAVTTMAFLATVTAASAQTPAYPPPPNGIRCLNDDDLVFVQGADAVFQANTFMAGTDVTFTLFSAPFELGTVPADADGFATVNSKIPLDAEPGPHRVEATGLDPFGEALTLVLDITVVRADPLPSEDPPGSTGGGGGPLPRTGSDSFTLVQAAVAVLVAGGFLLILANRRKAALVPVSSQRSSQV